MGEAGQKQKVIAKTEKTPMEVVQGSIGAGCLFAILILGLLAAVWLMLEVL